MKIKITMTTMKDTRFPLILPISAAEEYLQYDTHTLFHIHANGGSISSYQYRVADTYEALCESCEYWQHQGKENVAP